MWQGKQVHKYRKKRYRNGVIYDLGGSDSTINIKCESSFQISSATALLICSGESPIQWASGDGDEVGRRQNPTASQSELAHCVETRGVMATRGGAQGEGGAWSSFLTPLPTSAARHLPPPRHTLAAAAAGRSMEARSRSQEEVAPLAVVSTPSPRISNLHPVRELHGQCQRSSLMVNCPERDVIAGHLTNERIICKRPSANLYQIYKHCDKKLNYINPFIHLMNKSTNLKHNYDFIFSTEYEQRSQNY